MATLTFTWIILLSALSAVTVYNLYLWQHDTELADKLRNKISSVPVLSCTPKVSALVAAWNEHDHIDDHILSFVALTYPDIELILCAGGTDDTLERARFYASTRVIVLEQRDGEGKQAALARCLERASGEIIYFTDADCIFVEEALIRLLAPLINGHEQATTGTSRPLNQQLNRVLPYYLWASDVAYSIHSPMYGTGMLGRNAAVTRQALERSGGLAFTAATGTDYQLAQRLLRCGTAICQVAPSIVPSKYPETLNEYRLRRSRWLRNLIIYGSRYGSKRDVLVTTRTLAIGALMIITPFVSIIVGKSVLLLWTILFVHAVISKIRYLFFTESLHKQPIPPRLLPSLIGLTFVDFVIWTLPILDLFDTKRREKW